jgi:hypothetical protein
MLNKLEKSHFISELILVDGSVGDVIDLKVIDYGIWIN